MKFKASDTTASLLKNRVEMALGTVPADVVIRGSQVLDVFTGEFASGDVAICGNTIVGVQETYDATQIIDGSGYFLVPGFIDSHVHIESSLTTPDRFQEVVLPRGTTTAFWDPHEIANVLGKPGIQWAIDSVQNLLLDVFVLLPSCVPASHLETSGGTLYAADLLEFKGQPKVLGLAEFMNYPGIFSNDADVAAKLEMFADGVRDGHAPQLRGKKLNAYLCGGIQCCHESTSYEEASEKLRKGMHVLIREGSCAKDAHALLPLITPYTSAVLGLCTDDRNPADIRAEGHLDFVINLGLKNKIDPVSLFRTASFGAARAFGFMDRGVIAPGYLADICMVKQNKKGSWDSGFEVVKVFKKGKAVDAQELSEVSKSNSTPFQNYSSKPNINMPVPKCDSLKIATCPVQTGKVNCKVIHIIKAQLITDRLDCFLNTNDRGEILADVENDILKIAVFERHHNTGNIGVGLVKGFDLKKGAIAASIGHDSHNITAVGSNDVAILAAVAEIARLDGGIAVVDASGNVLSSLALPFGGLMTHDEPGKVADAILALKHAANSIGCCLEEPFLQLSFLALPVIPSLKITDKGLIDVDAFECTSVFVE